MSSDYFVKTVELLLIYFYTFATQLCWRRQYVSQLSVHRVCSFVWTDLITTISHERLEQSR